MMKTLEFTVIGEEKMHCAGCETRVGAALRRLEGVRDVAASAQTQRIRVTIDPTAVSTGQIRARLAQIGYDVEETEPEQA